MFGKKTQYRIPLNKNDKFLSLNQNTIQTN